MYRQRRRHRQTFLRQGTALAALVTAVLLASPAAATTRAATSPWEPRMRHSCARS